MFVCDRVQILTTGIRALALEIRSREREETLAFVADRATDRRYSAAAATVFSGDVNSVSR